MGKKVKAVLLTFLFVGILALSGLYIGTHNVPVLDPKGFIAVKQRELLITASLLMLIVVIPVFILTLFFSWRYRASNEKAKHTPDWEHNYVAEYCWWGIPFIIVVILAVITWKSSHELSPFKPIVADNRPITVQAVALEWKWLFIYPDQGIAVVNHMKFPEKTPIDFEITADAPMNSLWIPQLGGQIYAMPAMKTELHLIASEKGEYRGASANFSGTGFEGMHFIAEASSQKEFNDWVRKVRRSSPKLTFGEYLRLAQPSENDPVSSYFLLDDDLFEEILKQYKPR